MKNKKPKKGDVFLLIKNPNEPIYAGVYEYIEKDPDDNEYHVFKPLMYFIKNSNTPFRNQYWSIYKDDKNLGKIKNLDKFLKLAEALYGKEIKS